MQTDKFPRFNYNADKICKYASKLEDPFLYTDTICEEIGDMLNNRNKCLSEPGLADYDYRRIDRDIDSFTYAINKIRKFESELLTLDKRTKETKTTNLSYNASKKRLRDIGEKRPKEKIELLLNILNNYNHLLIGATVEEKFMNLSKEIEGAYQPVTIRKHYDILFPNDKPLK